MGSGGSREKKDDPDARLAMVLLRYLRGWDQGELARAARIAPSQISVYDRGGRPVPRDVLERVAVAADFPLYLLDPLLRVLRSFRLAAQGRSRAERVMGDVISAELIALIHTSIAGIVDALAPEDSEARPPAAADREEAAGLWARMERRTAAQRRALVEETEEYRSWALCERVAAASAEAAEDDPRQALELAELSRQIAELSPGKEAWRRRLQGYAWAHVSNARRLCGDLAGAGEASDRAWKLWQAGAPGDPGLLDEGVVLGTVR